MKRIGFLLLAVVTVAGIVAYTARASAKFEGNSSRTPPQSMASRSPPDTAIGN